ncbi:MULTISPECIES: hypothetical protein [Haloferacaceae]|uniref:Uncharacterized protein n=2 Tax=Haloferacaceae TaxID=1644056 RepID=A0ABD6DD44_9EURY|nr:MULTISPECIES: hypothetical protein [Halorubraceae]
MTTTDSGEIIDTNDTDRRRADLPTPEVLETQSQQYPEGAIDAVLYCLGFQVWTEPTSPTEQAEQATKVTTGIYAIVCLTNAQFEERHPLSPSPNWAQIRSHRELIFATCFNCPELFETLEYDTPDDMFDAVEIGLEATGYLDAESPPREAQFVTELAFHQDISQHNLE